MPQPCCDMFGIVEVQLGSHVEMFAWLGLHNNDCQIENRRIWTAATAGRHLILRREGLRQLHLRAGWVDLSDINSIEERLQSPAKDQKAPCRSGGCPQWTSKEKTQGGQVWELSACNVFPTRAEVTTAFSKLGSTTSATPSDFNAVKEENAWYAERDTEASGKGATEGGKASKGHRSGAMNKLATLMTQFELGNYEECQRLCTVDQNLGWFHRGASCFKEKAMSVKFRSLLIADENMFFGSRNLSHHITWHTWLSTHTCHFTQSFTKRY